MRSRINLFFIPVIALMACLSSGCHRDPPVTAAAVSEVKMQITSSSTSSQSLPYTGPADTVQYTYDGSGRQLTAQSDSTITSYTYGAGTISQHISIHNSDFVTTYSTNSSGQAVSDSKGYTYIYDSQGYLTGLWSDLAGVYDSVWYTITGGNVDTFLEHQGDPATSNLMTRSYTYISTRDSRSFGLSWMGRPNTNLISTETDVQVINGSLYSLAYIYSYSFDALGRVAQMVKTSGSATYTTAYTYY